jgi:hypothetical protein
MEVSKFEEIQVEFMQRVTKAIYCNVATVDRKNRPRSRMMHPIWDGPTGWVISWPESHNEPWRIELGNLFDEPIIWRG